MKKILVKAYVQKNLGDDLFLDILFKRYPNTLFYLEAPSNYNDIFRAYKNIRIIEHQKRSGYYKYIDYLFRHFCPPLFRLFFKIMQKRHFEKTPFLKEIDAFVLIGGSVFIQSKFLRGYDDVEYYKLLPQLVPGISMFFLGGNFGPYNDPLYFKEFEKIFTDAKDVCFREKYSQKLFSSIKTVRFAPDIVFGSQFSRMEKKENTVGFSLISVNNRANLNADIQDMYYEKNAELISKFVQEGKEVYLFSFCQKEGDENAISKILERIDSRFMTKIKLCFYSGDINTFIEMYSQVEQMFCGRFHSIILSLLFDQRIFPVIYSSKMTNVLEDIGYGGSMVNIENFGSVDYEVVRKEIICNEINIDQIKDKAVLQFKKLDEFLN
jgi:colanic acid/amylovoran biosynthesis protein